MGCLHRGTDGIADDKLCLDGRQGVGRLGIDLEINAVLVLAEVRNFGHDGLAADPKQGPDIKVNALQGAVCVHVDL